MASSYLDIATTPAVRLAQEVNGSAQLYDKIATKRRSGHLSTAEAEFIAERNSFYMASVSETGWPYVQHRGGPTGFLTLLDSKTLAFADYSGNRQYISLGNITENDRVALIMMDYPNRHRLKLYARIEVRNLVDDPALVTRLAHPEYRALVERAFLLHFEASDWNCPQHITPRYDEIEIAAASAPLTARLAALETENATLRADLASQDCGS
jgi:predicted pyridoxine 5'-phosphate oxidase superfamily flavin-nucleotide-binding protein